MRAAGAGRRPDLRLRDRRPTGHAGLGALKGGILYPLLARSETAGLVAVEWRAGEGGPGRTYYVLTDDGICAWHAQAARWAAIARLTTDLVTSNLAATGTQATTGPQLVQDGARR